MIAAKTLVEAPINFGCIMKRGQRTTNDTYNFTVSELKEKLKRLGLNTTGTKAKLINRLMLTDSMGA